MDQSSEVLGEGLEGEALNRAIFEALHPDWVTIGGVASDTNGLIHLIPRFENSMDTIIAHIPDDYAFGSQGWFINRDGSRVFPFWIHARPDVTGIIDGDWIGYGYTRRSAAAHALLIMARDLRARKERANADTP